MGREENITPQPTVEELIEMASKNIQTAEQRAAQRKRVTDIRECCALHEMIPELISTNELLQSQHKALRSHARSMKVQIPRLKQTLVAKQKQLARMKEKLALARNARPELSEEDDLAQELVNLGSEGERINREIRESEEEIMEGEERLQRTLYARDKYARLCASGLRKTEDLDNRLAYMRAIIDKKSEFAKNIEEMRNMFTAETATFEKMFKEFSTQTEQANKRMAEEVGPVMQVLHAWKSKLSFQERELQHVTALRNRRKAHLKRLNEEHDTLLERMKASAPAVKAD